LSPIHAAKNELRQKMRDARAALDPSDVTRRSDAAAARLLDLPQVRAARRVALYAPILAANEIRTAAIHTGLAARGAAVAYPRVHAPGAPLTFHAVADPADLVVSGLGIPQPDPASSALALTDIEVFVVPGLAFDELGERLGWGRGHYDRTLARAPAALRVGYAYQIQIVPRVPVGAGDERVDLVVTESAVLVPSPPRRTS
jgi:5-formyltetrahydrofolate cyclo-ligase